MKIKNKENKRSFRINVIDIVIILVVAAAVFAVYFLFLRDGTEGKGDTEILYTVRISDIKSELVPHINVGDNVTEANKRYAIGTVADGIREEAYKVDLFVADEFGGAGAYVSAEYPGHSNVYIPISAKAEVTSEGYFVSGYEMHVGQLVYIRLPDFAGSGYIVSIQTVEN